MFRRTLNADMTFSQETQEPFNQLMFHRTKAINTKVLKFNAYLFHFRSFTSVV